MPKWQRSRLVHRSPSALPSRQRRFPRSGSLPEPPPAPRSAFPGENLCTRRDLCHFGPKFASSQDRLGLYQSWSSIDRPALLHDRERGAQMVGRRASEARNNPNGRHGLQAMSRTHATPKRRAHSKLPPDSPPPALLKNGGRSQTVLSHSQAAQRPPRQAPHPPRQRSASTVPVAALPPCSRLTGCETAFSRRRRGRGVSREAICTRSHTAATAS